MTVHFTLLEQDIQGLSESIYIRKYLGKASWFITLMERIQMLYFSIIYIVFQILYVFQKVAKQIS